EGAVDLIDCMPIRSDSRLDVVRLVRGVSGAVPMRMDLVVRFDYGSIVPWTRAEPDGARFVAGPDALNLACDPELTTVDDSTTAEFTVHAGEEVSFDLAWRPSHAPEAEPINVVEAIESTVQWWKAWLAGCERFEPYDRQVRQSLAVLKGLTY